ncbi:MAG: hypothetical protein J6C53_02620 [Clostridia bacterium]|nr:hypothetical protein [Clostridia bacterium]
MRRKTKLITSIVFMVLVAILTALGIWAVVGGDIGIGGDISFEAQELEVTISGYMYGHDKNHMTEENAEQLPGDEFGKQDDSEIVKNSLDWTGLDLVFVDKNVDIIIEVFITNNHLDKAVRVSPSDKSQTEGKNFSVTIDCSGTATKDIISVGETINYTITLKILDKGMKVDGILDIIFSLTNEI